ncbi:MAG: elongation factor 1-beta [Nanoarchaeota archaeon]|nr:elongation factor 1-beta [Nanoarchaeota archaeon]
MSNAIITFKIMPESPDVDLDAVKEQALKIASAQGAKGEMQAKIEPLAFGLKQLMLLAMFEVSDDVDFDTIAEKFVSIEGVQSAEVAQMDLAMG